MKSLNRKTGFIAKENRRSFYTFIALWIIGFALFQVIPIFWGFRVSLTNRMAFSLVIKNVGLKNYIRAFSDTKVMVSIAQTFYYSLANTFIQVVLGLFLALLLEKRMRGHSIFRVMFYLPYVIPIVATGWIFRIFLDKNVGTLNLILTNLGLIEQKISWLGSYPLLSVLSANFWRVGWSLLIFLGGLSTIPHDLYDSAEVDGANYLKRVRIITIPFLSPFIAFQLVISFIYGMQMFIMPFILNPTPMRGGQLTSFDPPQETFFILARGYSIIFNDSRLAYGFAVLWINFLIVLIFSLIYTRLIKRYTYSEIEG
ncbi:MAG: carbohydrate ABC transporter permease [Spirochaetia bacterium]